MWQKINRWLIRQVLIAPLPIFAKMVLLYSAIVFFILLTVSVATLTSIHYIMNNGIIQIFSRIIPVLSHNRNR